MTESTESRCPLPAELVLSSTIAVLAGANLHAQTAESIGNAVLGLLNANRLSVTAIGSALGRVTGHKAKHGVKQVDRLMSNELFNVEDCQKSYVQKVVGQRKSIVVGMDWTEYALDGQSTIAISLITKCRRPPVSWGIWPPTSVSANGCMSTCTLPEGTRAGVTESNSRT